MGVWCSADEIRSPNIFDQRFPTKRIVSHHQQKAKRCQVVWQFAIGTGAHVVNERGNRVSELASVEIIEGSLLAPRHILLAVTYQGTIHFTSPMR